MSLTPGDRAVYRLPPRPGLGSWWGAGAGAGLAFGCAELVVAMPGGAPPPPALALTLVAGDALAVCVGSGLVGLALRAAGRRLSRSAMVGAVVAPMLFASASAEIWRQLAADGLPTSIEFSGAMTALLFAIAAGMVTSRLAGAYESSGIPVSAAYVWFAAAIPLAISERVLAQGLPAGAIGVLVPVVALGSFALCAWGSVAVARRRGLRSPRGLGWLASWLTLAALALAFGPMVLPWLWFEPDRSGPIDGPPCVLVAALPGSRPGAGDTPLPVLEFLAFEGVSYEPLLAGARPGVRSVLADAAGSPIVEELVRVGYATGAFLPGGTAPAIPELAGAEVDDRSGPRGLLENELRWVAAAPLLLGPGTDLMEAVGLIAENRDVRSLNASAQSWLLDWHTDRAPAPFFLFVDYRDPDAGHPTADRAERAERADTALSDLLEHLRMLGASDRTLVVALREQLDDRGVVRVLRAIVRLPTGWSIPGARRVDAVFGSELASAIVRASLLDASTPIELPGVASAERDPSLLLNRERPPAEPQEMGGAGGGQG